MVAVKSTDSASDAAMFLMLLGEERAVEVIRYMSAKEIKVIAGKMDALTPWKRGAIVTLLRHFEHAYADVSPLPHDGKKGLRGALQQALGQDRARCLLKPFSEEASDPLMSIQLLDPGQLTDMICEEPLAFQAAVLACLHPSQAADTFAKLPEERRAPILNCMAGMDNLPTPTLEIIVAVLEGFMKDQAEVDVMPLSGEQQVADMLNLCNPNQRQVSLTDLKTADSALAARVEAKMLLFEHVVRLTDGSLRHLVMSIDQAELCLALKGADEEVKDAIFRSMTKRSREYLQDDMASQGPIAMSKVKKARAEIVRTMSGMLKGGELEMIASGEVMLE